MKQLDMIIELKAPNSSENFKQFLEKIECLIDRTNRVSIVSKPSTLSESSFDSNYYFANFLTELKPNIEILFHLTCRDLNKVNIQPRLCLLKSLGIKQLLVVTGDNYCRPAEDGELHFLDSNELVSYIADNCNWFKSLGVAGYPGGNGKQSQNNSEELLRLRTKLLAGANVIYTQCLFDLKAYEEFVNEVKVRFERVDIVPSVAVFDSSNALERILVLTRVASLPSTQLITDNLRKQLSCCNAEQAELVAECYLTNVLSSIRKLQSSKCTIDLCTFGSYKLAEKLVGSLYSNYKLPQS